jgi:hypothetical protein
LQKEILALREDLILFLTALEFELRARAWKAGALLLELCPSHRT